MPNMTAQYREWGCAAEPTASLLTFKVRKSPVPCPPCLPRYGGSLAALDTGPSSPLNQRLVYPGLEALGTVYEGSFGDWLADVYYISWWAERRRQQRILVSLPGIPHAPARRRRPELG